jgi:F-type H+-transporting ATPase subunit delta
MLASLIAQRYAQALFQAARDAKDLERVAAEAHGLEQALDARTLSVLSRPTLAAADKVALFDKALQGASPVLTMFLKAVVENKREKFLPGILKQVQGLVLESQGRVQGTVTSAVALSEKELAAIADALSKRLKRKVDLKPLTDATLLGGLKVQVGDTVYDGTLANGLRRLGEALTSLEAAVEPKKA